VIIALTIPPDFAKSIGFHMNGGGYEPDWRYSLTFTENYKMLIEDGVPKTTPLSVFWSLCIEEHFYILWMIVFFVIPRKAIPYYLLASIIAAPTLRIFHDQIYGTLKVINQDVFTNLDYFAISGLLGYFVALNYQKVERIILRIPLGVRIFYVVLVIVALNYQKTLFLHDIFFFKYFKYTLFAVMFTMLLACFLPVNGPLKISDNNILSKLGKISYGLYVYHIVWIHVVLQYMIDHDVVIDNWRTYGYYMTITFAGTLATSWISWKFFEKPLLNLREKLFPSS
jgi:peptidoglycan/LPS O-acetylase OafA/YrhL